MMQVGQEDALATASTSLASHVLTVTHVAKKYPGCI
jgi:hypothetical protein